ncbi:MAG: hypothetical protein GYA15_11685 [Leptolinea sp.]|nr:hypothetical protein [Leptolinea sp.]
MRRSNSRDGFCNPFGCLLFLLGLGFLATGIISGTVVSAINELQSNTPSSSESIKTLGIWAAVTFGSLGLGLLGIRSYGLRDSAVGIGLMFVVLGLAGLAVYYLEVQIPVSGNALWETVRYLIDLTGSLLYTSLAFGGAGLLLILITLLVGSGHDPGKRKSTGYTQVLVCHRCGHSNPVWLASCEKCGAQIPMAENNTPIEY